MFYNVRRFFVIGGLFSFFFSGLCLLHEEVIIGVSLVARGVHGVSGVNQYVLIGTCSLSGLVRTLRVDGRGTIGYLFSGVGHCNVSRFHPNRFTSHQYGHGLVFILQGCPVSVFVHKYFHVSSLLAASKVVFSIGVGLVFMLHFRARFHERSIFLGRHFHFYGMLLSLLSSVQVRAARHFHRVNMMRVAPHSRYYGGHVTSRN